MKFILAIGLLLTAYYSHSQDSLLADNNQITYKWPKYRLNGEKLSNKELKTQLMKFPESALEYKKFRKWYTAACVTAVAGIAIVLLTPEKDIYNPNKNLGFRIAGWSLVGTGGIVFPFIAVPHRQNAVKNYNKKVIRY